MRCHATLKKYFSLQPIDYGVLLAIFCFSLWLENHLFLNWDLGWHLEGAKRLLAGGAYSQNVFDDNLPMVFWFLMPVVWLHQVTHLSVVALTIFYLHLTVLLSFLLSHIFLKEIYTHSKNWEIRTIQYIWVILLLFFPGWEFGQRDMLVLALVMPYIILLAARLETRAEYHHFILQGTIGVLAAIGIAMNPFYGLVILVIEIQRWITSKKIMLFRPELLTFLISLILYFCVVVILYPDYFTVIIPSFLVFSPFYNVSLLNLILSSPSRLFIIAVFLFLFSYSSLHQRAWLMTLWLSAIVAYFIFLLHQKLWMGHTIFFLLMSDLMVVIVLCQSVQLIKKDMIRFGMSSIFSLAYLICAVHLVSVNYSVAYAAYRNQKFWLNQMISFFNKQPKNATLYFFSANVIVYPMLNYTHVINLFPGPNCWQIPAISAMRTKTNLALWKRQWIQKYKTLFIQKTVDDFQYKKPNYIIVDMSVDMNKTKKSFPFDYITFLKQNKQFCTLWKSYHLAKIIYPYDPYHHLVKIIYPYEIYVRH